MGVASSLFTKDHIHQLMGVLWCLKHSLNAENANYNTAPESTIGTPLEERNLIIRFRTVSSKCGNSLVAPRWLTDLTLLSFALSCDRFR